MRIFPSGTWQPSNKWLRCFMFQNFLTQTFPSGTCRLSLTWPICFISRHHLTRYFAWGFLELRIGLQYQRKKHISFHIYFRYFAAKLGWIPKRKASIRYLRDHSVKYLRRRAGVQTLLLVVLRRASQENAVCLWTSWCFLQLVYNLGYILFDYDLNLILICIYS